MRKTTRILSLVVLIAGLALVLGGCKKNKPTMSAEEVNNPAPAAPTTPEKQPVLPPVVPQPSPEQVAAQANAAAKEVSEETKKALEETDKDAAKIADGGIVGEAEVGAVAQEEYAVDSEVYKQAEKDVSEDVARKSDEESARTLNRIRGSAEIALEKTRENDEVILDIKLPEPAYTETPDIKVPNLEVDTMAARSPFLVPKGTKNVALGKPISSTDENPSVGNLAMIVDGDKNADNYVELAPGTQSITIDLEAEYEIYAVVVWHYHKEPRVYFDVIVELGNDPDLAVDPITIFNSDYDDTSKQGAGSDSNYIESYQGKLISGKGNKARYVKLYSNGNTANKYNDYVEVEVYAVPAEAE